MYKFDSAKKNLDKIRKVSELKDHSRETKIIGGVASVYVVFVWKGSVEGIVVDYSCDTGLPVHLYTILDKLVETEFACRSFTDGNPAHVMGMIRRVIALVSPQGSPREKTADWYESRISAVSGDLTRMTKVLGDYLSQLSCQEEVSGAPNPHFAAMTVSSTMLSYTGLAALPAVIMMSSFRGFTSAKLTSAYIKDNNINVRTGDMAVHRNKNGCVAVVLDFPSWRACLSRWSSVAFGGGLRLLNTFARASGEPRDSSCIFALDITLEEFLDRMENGCIDYGWRNLQDLRDVAEMDQTMEIIAGGFAGDKNDR